MHLVFGATGIKHFLDLFEEFMATRSFWLPFIDHNDGDKEKAIYLQSQLRPIRFYDFIFPRGELDHVLNGLQPERDFKSKNISKFTSAGLNTSIAALRTALKLKKIPKPDLKQGAMPLFKQNVRVVGIGIREDEDIFLPNRRMDEDGVLIIDKQAKGITHEGV